MKKTRKLTTLLLAAVLLLACLPMSVGAVSPLPEFKVDGDVVSWDNSFTRTDPYGQERPYGFSEFEISGFEENSSWGFSKENLVDYREYCDVRWALPNIIDPTTGKTDPYAGHISVNIQDLIEYWSARSDKPYAARVYTITIQCGSDHWNPVAQSTFNYDYQPRSSGVHGVYFGGDHCTATPKLGKPGTLMVVKAENRAGYTFDHWQVDGGSVTLADPNSAETSFKMPSENVTLTPIYQQTGEKHTVTEYYKGSAFKRDYFPGEKVNLMVLESDWDDDFDHWEVIYGGITISDAEDGFWAHFTMPDNDVAVLAVFEDDPPFTPEEVEASVSFDANGGSGSMETQSVKSGEKFTFPVCTFTPPAGKVFDFWSVAGKKNSFFEPGDSMEITADVTVKANWKDAPAEQKKNPFVDVKESHDIYTAVIWAYYADPQITNGMDATHFGPASTVTRGQAVTFLWRAMGCPEPTAKTNPFTDVKETDYFYRAVLWATEKGVTLGTDGTHFTPDQTCSTAHILTFLYRTLGIGADGWYAVAETWAKSAGLMDGHAVTVSPETDCPRADVVFFLHRALAK